MGFLDKLFRVDARKINKYAKAAQKVLAFEQEMRGLSDEELQAKTPYFRDKLANGSTLEEIKAEAFAVAREAAQRTLGQFPFKVQVMGALVLHEGDVAEMKTGEGKTLTATMAVYLNALEGKGVHVVTVNEYLAARDAEWMGQIYRFLGLTVGVNIRDKSTSEKRDAHNCDITYTTNSELGFDYLRDNMSQTTDRRVLRSLNMAVIDEADSILIDESRTPLIISGGSKASPSQYTVADRFVKALRKEDYNLDLEQKSVAMTDSGNSKAERMFGIRNLYDPEYADLVHRIQQALKANYGMARNVEYMVDDNKEIQLIDQFTGRILKGREYSDGLHQAIQAKENVTIKQETITMATITYQNFFRLFVKLAGMTGTAKTEEEEFRKIYNMRVVQIPTNRPIVRKDEIDLVYNSKTAKLNALIAEVAERHAAGQPMLIGTVSVESSEEISELLTAAGLPHEILNAKNHAREAEIISKAGEKGSITLATNMAGRGTDIKINDEVKALGGLAVLGTERHEARRIDNQLRGRSGRQGDPGYSRFYISLDDELMLRFGNSEQLKKYFASLGDDAIESKMISGSITGAQKRIEGKNFDMRKNVLDYDDVLAKQRKIVYERRDKILYQDDINDIIAEAFQTAGKFFAEKAVKENSQNDPVVSGQLVKEVLEPKFLDDGFIDLSQFDDLPVLEASEEIADLLLLAYQARKKEWPEEHINSLEHSIVLRTMDMNWTKHIDAMAHLREGIYLRSYANHNPLQDYVNEGYRMFREMFETISVDVVLNFLRAQIQFNRKSDEEENPEGENTENIEPKKE